MWWKKRERTFARIKSGRKEGSGDETTLIGVYAQVAFHTTQFLLLMQSGSSQATLEDSIMLSFSVWMVGKSLCITRKTLTTLSLYCAFRNLDSCWTLYIEGTCLSITNCNVLLCGTTTGSCTTLSSTVNWTTRFLRLRSCLVRIVHLASFRVHFSICAVPSIQHFIISPTHSSSFFIESCPIPKHCKGASTSLQWFGKFFLLVSFDWFFAQALLGTSLSLSWWSFTCSSLLTRAAVTLSATLLACSSKSWSCLSANFCFSGTIFLGSSTQTIWSSGFSFTAAGCPIFLPTFCHVSSEEGKHEEDKKHRERNTKRWRQAFTSGCPAGCLCHSITRNALLLPNLAKTLKIDAFSLVNSGPSTQSFSHAQITPTRDVLFRSWWPFTPLPSLISLGDVSCPLPSDLLGKTWRAKKGRRKMKIKNKKMKRKKKVTFPRWNFLFRRTIEAKKSEKQNDW